MSTKGQTINDRINAAKYTLAGQALARCICKATTEELMRPKKKHLDYLTGSTYQQSVSMQQLTNLLIERTNHTNWVVVYKALITVHHLMSCGSERFTQYLASSNYTFQLSNFLDCIVAKGYNMSQFIRRYSNYLNEKALSYRKLAMDMCRTQRRKGHTDSLMKSMPIERLLETLPVIQNQLDSLLNFGCTADDLSNSIITASFTLLFQDAIRLFANYNDGIINLIEHYFDLNKKMCREAFEAYKKYLASAERMVEFLKVADAINLNTGEVPDFKRAPSSLLDAFEQHLHSLETNRRRDINSKVDTRLAAVPSFTISDASDMPFRDKPQRTNDQSPTSDDITKHFDAQLNFATSDNEFDVSNTAKNNNNNTKKNMLAGSDDVFASQAFGNQFSTSPMPANVKSSIDNNNLINQAFVVPTQSKFAISETANAQTSPFEPVVPSSNPIEMFDVRPPGFADGTLLTPEALQINIDPSVDPQTKQQLIQIKREQVMANRQGSGNSQQPTTTKQTGNKPSRESMFEDLEKTMRKSLLKTENA